MRIYDDDDVGNIIAHISEGVFFCSCVDVIAASQRVRLSTKHISTVALPLEDRVRRFTIYNSSKLYDDDFDARAALMGVMRKHTSTKTTAARNMLRNTRAWQRGGAAICAAIRARLNNCIGIMNEFVVVVVVGAKCYYILYMVFVLLESAAKNPSHHRTGFMCCIVHKHHYTTQRRRRRQGREKPRSSIYSITPRTPPLLRRMLCLSMLHCMCVRALEERSLECSTRYAAC